MAKRNHWLNATVLGIGLASLASDLSHEAVTSVLPGFLASMGVAAAALGTIEGVADGLSTLAKLYGGWWADRMHRRKTLCASGYGFMALATVLIAIAKSWLVVLLGRGLAWVARGIRTPARKSLLAEAATPETYGRAFGFERMMDTLGAVLAPLLVLGLLRTGRFHARDIIWISVLPALLAVWAIVFLVKEKREHAGSPRPFLESFGGLPGEFTRFLRWVGLFGAGDFAHSLMILYAIRALEPRLGYSGATTSAVALYALHNAVYAGVSYPIGALADRKNKRILLALGYGLGALTACLLALGVKSLPMLSLVFALGGAYIGMEETLEDSLSAGLLPPSRRGSGFGLLALVNGLGDLVSSVTVGWLWAGFGPAAAFGAAALVMGAGASAVWLSRRP